MLVLFTLLIINVNYIQVVRSDELRNDPGNTRVLAEEYDRERGSIVVGGNEIALSVPTDDRLTYLRQYPQGALYAAVTGYYSLIYGKTGHRAGRERRARRLRPAAVRPPPRRPVHRARPGRRRRRPDAGPGRAEGRDGRPRRA